MSDQREILFRGKSIDSSEWLYGDYMGYTDSTSQIWQHTDDGTWNAVVHPETVGQYTGLKDENGKRIFEGDIVTIDGGDGYFLVKWDPDIARFEMSGDGLVVDFDNFYPHEFEIAGNIHDNPELLEESQ